MLELLWTEDVTEDTRYKVLFPIATPLKDQPPQVIDSEPPTPPVSVLKILHTAASSLISSQTPSQKNACLRFCSGIFSLMWLWRASHLATRFCPFRTAGLEALTSWSTFHSTAPRSLRWKCRSQTVWFNKW